MLTLSTGTIFNILYGDLGLMKKSARWASRLLGQNQKGVMIACSRDFKNMVEADSSALNRIVTANVGLCYHMMAPIMIVKVF